MARPPPAAWRADPGHSRPTRRDAVRAGWLGGLGLSPGAFLKLEAAADPVAPKKAAKAKSVIHVYLQGGFAHMDSFDPKPDAPAEYRGMLEPAATKPPGVDFSEHMRNTAAVADKVTLVRSMSHTEVDHGRGHLACLKLKSGEAAWELNLREEFPPQGEPKWGGGAPVPAPGRRQARREPRGEGREPGGARPARPAKSSGKRRGRRPGTGR